MDKLPPAPWTAEQDDEEAVTGEWTIKDSDGGYVAQVSSPYVIFDMQVAYAQDPSCQLQNIARLIAAAPELLEALQEVAELTKRQQLPLTAQIHELVTTAISKATS